MLSRVLHVYACDSFVLLGPLGKRVWESIIGITVILVAGQKGMVLKFGTKSQKGMGIEKLE